MGDHKNHIVHVGDHTYMWGDHMLPIPCKVWGDHKSHIRYEDTLHVGDCMYMLGDHTILVPYKVRGTLDTYSI